MSKPIPTRHHNPCQICGDTSGKCRETPTTLLCMEITDAYNCPPGFKFRGLSSDGNWGKFTKNETVSDPSRREEFVRQQRQKRQQRLQVESNRLGQLLCESERDKNIRKIIRQLGLSQQHKADLQRRGLTDEQIAAGMFRSVEQWQKLDFEVSHRLGGVAIDGKSLITQSGYICPIWNVTGEIVGWQLRADDRENGKYKWASSQTKKRPNGPTSHLQSGELPITCCRPIQDVGCRISGVEKNQSNTPNTRDSQNITKGGEILGCKDVEYPSPYNKVIRLGEGFLKPWISAQLSGEIYLGAAGANFASSPKIVKAYLDQLAEELGGIDKLVLDADAGAITNRHVMRQYRRIRDLLKKLGYELHIGWWNQLTKDDLDIDELLAAGRGEEIKIITFAQFEQIARQQQQWSDDIITAFGRLAKQLTKTFKGFGDTARTHRGREGEDRLSRSPQMRLGASPEGISPEGKTSQDKSLSTISYIPGKLPTFKEYLKLGSPKIIYSQGQRHQIWQELVTKGYHLIQDASAAGSGKSHAVGEVTLQEFGANKLFYLASDHRNPNVGSIEQKYADLPPRHNGLYEDTTKQTPLGNNHIRWAKEGEKANIAGNCFRAPLFHLFSTKGYQLEVSQEAGINPICKTCHLRYACRGRDFKGNSITPVTGASFRQDRAKVLQEPYIRAHLGSIPSHIEFRLEEPQTTQPKIGAFVDEASRQLTSVDFTEIGLDDFDRTLMKLQCDNPSAYEQIKSILLPLRPLLTGETPIKNYHGWGHSALQGIIARAQGTSGEIPENLTDIIALLQENALKLEEILKQPDSVTLEGLSNTERKKVDRATIKFVRNKLRQESYREIEQEVKNLPSNWLIPLLSILAGTLNGAIRIKNRRLIIATKNSHQADTIKEFDFAFLLDATADRDYLAPHLDVEPREIALIQEELPQYTNLVIQQITGMGLLGKDRSNSMKVRLAALREKLQLRHPNIAFIDHLATKEKGDGYWFVENRGSNNYQNLSAIASFGKPYQDIGALQQIYITLTTDADVDKDSPGFSAFVNHLVEAEVVQYVGRLRANRRSQEQLTCYIVAEGDLSYLEQYYPGATFKTSTAFEITPDAGTPLEQTKWAILQAVRKLVDAEEKITQQAIGQIIGRNQGRISQIAAEIGGWKVLKKILVALIKNLYSTANNFSPDWTAELTEEEKWLAQAYLPLILDEAGQNSVQVVKEVVAVAESIGAKVFQRLLNLMQPFLKVSLLLHFVMLLPEGARMCIQKQLAGILQIQDLAGENLAPSSSLHDIGV